MVKVLLNYDINRTDFFVWRTMIWIIDTILYVFLEVFFFFSQIRKEPTNKHAKENLLGGPCAFETIELRAETRLWEEILTVTSRNWDFSVRDKYNFQNLWR